MGSITKAVSKGRDPKGLQRLETLFPFRAIWQSKGGQQKQKPYRLAEIRTLCPFRAIWQSKGGQQKQKPYRLAEIRNPLPFSEVGNITKAVSKGRDFCPLWLDETFRAFGRLSAHA
ncbi:hypothetical protein CIK92_09290 [Prevotella sp. P4-67]|nr:hypothetical protein CIK92_09290 [Prevotella sp. P4-67]